MLSISQVSFSRWRPHSVLSSSVIAVEKESDLSSPLLGVVFGGKCPTCYQTKHSCPGHFGSIRLTEPVYHISWIPHLLRMLKKHDGKFSWDKQKATILRNGEPFPASGMFDIMDDPPVIAVLPVPPPHVRPPLFVNGELKGENDLTYRLQNILRKNRHFTELKRCKRPDEIIQQGREALQNAVTGYINHEKLGPTRRARNKREYVSLESRIKKKNGRIRNNLMGKRSNFTARCVITGDDGLKLSEIGVPKSVARTLTIPVKVTDYNKFNLQDLVDNGDTKYVTAKDGSRSSKRTILEVGCLVERYLKDDDIVLFNRQPSLHKHSLMGHTVRILPYSTFRMNVACTSPYNADFDGDEMNLHVPQTIMAQCEAREIMAVKHNIISSQANCPVIGLIQDALLGTYLLSGATLRPDQAMQIAMQPTGCTGREIISTILPDITYERGGVKIVQGVFLEGRLTKRDVGKSNGSINHVIYNDLGADACVEFMFNMQRLAHRYLQVRGFTIGIGDLVRSKEASLKCEAERQAAFEEAKTAIDPNARLNACRSIMGKAVIEGMDETNNFFAMVHSGSKGSLVNLTQVQACLGQMNVQGGRMPMQWRERSATQFKRGERGPLSRGFVSHSYLDGLSPFEMFAHSMSGREGLIDTAIKTAQTGYTERKLMKCMENITTHIDGTVRDGKRIVQFLYGDDGFDGARVETQQYRPLADARDEDLQHLSETHYHFPVPIHRIVRRMELFGGVLPGCGPAVEGIANTLLSAFINVHTPNMLPTTRARYEREITKYLDRANICVGECVGALAAQSIGERTTQCTLNSVDYTEWLVLRGYPKDDCIGKVIDTIMDQDGYDLQNRSHVTEVEGLEAFTINYAGETSWKKVTHVTRHPPRPHRGSDMLVRICLTSGRTLVASRAKSFLVHRKGRLMAIDGADIVLGDMVPVLAHTTGGSKGFVGIGGFLGAFYACGKVSGGAVLFPEHALKYFEKNLRTFQPTIVREDDKMKILCSRLYYMVASVGKFPNIVLSLDPECRLQFCRAYIELKGKTEDGFICVSCGRYMRDGITFVLLGLGIHSKLSSRGFMLDPDGVEALSRAAVEVPGMYLEQVVEVNSVPSTHRYVYDLTVEETKNMCALNGIGCRDTFHFAGIGSKNVTLGIPRLREILEVSKKPKTPLTTVKDERALGLKYDVLSEIRLEPVPSDTIDNYWLFPDGEFTRDEVYERWGAPTRLVLRSDRTIVSMFEYAAYQENGDHIVLDVFGEIPASRGVPGAEWCKMINGRVETTLQDLSKIMEICDSGTLYTNDIYKMGQVYGIECARSCLLIEMRKILNHYGIYLNSRHLSILIDAMTQRGVLTPLTRHGLKKSESSALKRCTFEEVVTVLHEAALKEEVDPVDGVSPCILAGKVAKLGSNTVTVLKDHVMEKKWKVDPPKEPDGVDMWMPMALDFNDPMDIDTGPTSPTYMP